MSHLYSALEYSLEHTKMSEKSEKEFTSVTVQLHPPLAKAIANMSQSQSQ